MNKYDLIELLTSNDEEDVSVIINGTEYDISPEVEHIPESFDGFATAFPASIGLKLIEREDELW